MFNLEKYEKIIIAVLVLTLLAGLAISVYRKNLRVNVNIVGGLVNVRDESLAEKININKADVDELMRIRGVGKVLADRIVEYRSQKGLFLSPDDIKKVKGVGPSLFEKIKNKISIE